MAMKAAKKQLPLVLRRHPILPFLEHLYPLRHAGSWDNVGLLLEARCNFLTQNDVLLTIDLTEQVAREAINAKKPVALIISYHPIMFNGLNSITHSDPQGNTILQLLNAGISVYSPHTAIDAARGGVNDYLMYAATSKTFSNEEFCAMDHSILGDCIIPSTPRMCADHSTSTPQSGVGAQLGFDPERSDADLQLEILAGESKEPQTHRLRTILKDMGEDRTYFYEYENFEKVNNINEAQFGMGRLLDLEKHESVYGTMLLKTILENLFFRISKGAKLHLPEEPHKNLLLYKIRRIAVCAGSGGSMFKPNMADLYITGELKHHEILELTSHGAFVITMGHSQSERPFLNILKHRFDFLSKVKKYHPVQTPVIHVSKADRLNTFSITQVLKEDFAIQVGAGFYES